MKFDMSVSLSLSLNSVANQTSYLFNFLLLYLNNLNIDFGQQKRENAVSKFSLILVFFSMNNFKSKYNFRLH